MHKHQYHVQVDDNSKDDEDESDDKKDKYNQEDHDTDIKSSKSELNNVLNNSNAANIKVETKSEHEERFTLHQPPLPLHSASDRSNKKCYHHTNDNKEINSFSLKEDNKIFQQNKANEVKHFKYQPLTPPSPKTTPNINNPAYTTKLLQQLQMLRLHLQEVFMMIF